jgi:hypothetical protein
VEYIAWGLTLLGIALTILLARRPPLRMPEPAPTSSETLSRFLADDPFADGPFTDPPEAEADPSPG